MMLPTPTKGLCHSSPSGELFTATSDSTMLVVRGPWAWPRRGRSDQKSNRTSRCATWVPGGRGLQVAGGGPGAVPTPRAGPQAGHRVQSLWRVTDACATAGEASHRGAASPPGPPPDARASAVPRHGTSPSDDQSPDLGDHAAGDEVRARAYPQCRAGRQRRPRTRRWMHREILKGGATLHAPTAFGTCEHLATGVVQRR